VSSSSSPQRLKTPILSDNFDSLFIQSGDLRIHAIYSKLPEAKELIYWDGLIQEKNSIYTYDIDALQAQAAHYNTLDNTPSSFYLQKGGRQLFPNNLHTGGTCIIAGKDADLNFLEDIRCKGIAVIGVDDVPAGTEELTYYVCSKADASSTKHLRNANTLCFLPRVAYSGFTEGVAISHLPANIPFTITSGQSREFLYRMQDWGDTDAVILAFSFALVQGFSNIIFHGCQSNLDNALSFKRNFTGIYKNLCKKAIRIGLTEAVTFMMCPIYTLEYLRTYIFDTVTVAPHTTPSGYTIPEQEKALQKRRTARFHLITLADNIDAYAAAVPSVFADTTSAQEILQLKNALARPGGCRSCIKGRLARPLFLKFFEAARQGNPELMTAWATINPEQDVVALSGQQIRRTS